MSKLLDWCNSRLEIIAIAAILSFVLAGLAMFFRPEFLERILILVGTLVGAIINKHGNGNGNKNGGG